LILENEKEWYDYRYNLTITERFYRNKYVTLYVELAENSTLALAIVKVESYCDLCYPNVGYPRIDEKLSPDRLKAFNELKNYIDALWLKYGYDPWLKELIVEGYIVPRKALPPDEFIKLVENLNLIGKVKDVFYMVFDNEGNYVIGGGKRILKEQDFYEEINGIVKVAGHMMNIMNKSKTMDGLYIGSFVVRTSIDELMKINFLKDRIAFVYVPLDMLNQLRQKGYTIIEVRYTSILEALPTGIEY